MSRRFYLFLRGENYAKLLSLSGSKLLRNKEKSRKNECSLYLNDASILWIGFQVATYKITDRGDEFRIEIIGRFAADGVPEVKQSWQNALSEPAHRRLTVDISRLSGYDSAARKLLAEMYRHGTEFAARTPSSLVFLSEIANTPRTPAKLIAAPISTSQKKIIEQPLRVAAGQ